MKKFVFLIAVLLLAGCSSGRGPIIRSFDGALTPEMQQGKAIVIVGITLVPRRTSVGVPVDMDGAWVKYDPATGLRDPNVELDLKIMGGIFSGSAAIGGTRYDFFAVPPGSYALGWFGTMDETYFPTAFAQMRMSVSGGGAATGRSFSPLARVKPIAPSFTVAAGEVVYLGDLTFDVSQKREAKLLLKNNDAVVKKVIADRGYTGTPVVKLLKHADGSAMKETETISSEGFSRL